MGTLRGKPIVRSGETVSVLQQSLEIVKHPCDATRKKKQSIIKSSSSFSSKEVLFKTNFREVFNFQ